MNKKLLIENMKKIKALQAEVQQLKNQLEQMNSQSRKFKKPKRYKITLSEFLNPNTVTIVNTRTQAQYDKLVNACQKIMGISFFSDTAFLLYEKQTCLRCGYLIASNCSSLFSYCDKDFYLSKNYKVYDFSEIDLHK